jgi:tetratricopeptide (TPR) repeat protein
LAVFASGCLILFIGAAVCVFFLARGAVEVAQRYDAHEHFQREHTDYAPPVRLFDSELADITDDERSTYHDVLDLEGPAALTALGDLIERHPHCYNLYYDRAAVHRALGDLEGAMADYSYGLAIRDNSDSSFFPFDDSDVPPPPFVALLELAEVYEDMGLLEDAIETARHSLDEDPAHPYHPLVYIGALQCELGRYAEALPNFERALDCDDDWLFESLRPEARAGRDLALRGLGRVREF